MMRVLHHGEQLRLTVIRERICDADRPHVVHVVAPSAADVLEEAKRG